jgi:hypothetical protein
MMPGACQIVMLAALVLSPASPISLLAQEAKETGGSSLVLECFDFSCDGDDLALPLTFEGNTYPFILDTGADITAFDRVFRSRLGDMIGNELVVTPTGQATMETFRAPSAQVGTLNLRCVKKIGCIDLERLRRARGRDEYGIIGMDSLRSHVVRLDFDRGTVSFLKSAPRCSGSAVRLSYAGNTPLVEATIPGFGSRWFLVDTGFGGAAAGSLPADEFPLLISRRFLVPLGYGRSVDVSDFSLTGKSQRGRLAAIEIGSFRQVDLLFSEGQGGTVGDVRVLGLNFLKPYNVTFDFPIGPMYLAEKMGSDEPEPRDLSGLHLIAQNGRIVVDAVDLSSPAARAGIRVRDTLQYAGGMDATSRNLRHIEQALCRQGKKVRLAFERGGRMIDVTLKLEPFSEPAAALGKNRKRELVTKTR